MAHQTATEVEMKNYDVECFNLARHFLDDEPALQTDRHPERWRAACEYVALAVQAAVEDATHDLKDNGWAAPTGRPISHFDARG